MNTEIGDIKATLQGITARLEATSTNSSIMGLTPTKAIQGVTTRVREEPKPMINSMKLEVPKFDGTDPFNWIFKIQHYFQFYGIQGDQRLSYVSFALEGKASDWYHWMDGNNLIETWEEFLEQLKLNFGPSIYDDFKGELAKL